MFYSQVLHLLDDSRKQCHCLYYLLLQIQTVLCVDSDAIYAYTSRTLKQMTSLIGFISISFPL